jgi:hypothetical protein
MHPEIMASGHSGSSNLGNGSTHSTSKLAASLKDKSPKADALLELTQQHYKEHDVNDEVDFYQVKNTSMCSYLLDMANLIQVAVAGQCHSSGDADVGAGSATSVKESMARLDHMRVLLDKMRPLDNKLAYTMEKQLALANQKGGEHGNMAVSHRPNPTSMGMKMKQAKLKSASSSKQPSKRK